MLKLKCAVESTTVLITQEFHQLRGLNEKCLFLFMTLEFAGLLFWIGYVSVLDGHRLNVALTLLFKVWSRSLYFREVIRFCIVSRQVVWRMWTLSDRLDCNFFVRCTLFLQKYMSDRMWLPHIFYSWNSNWTSLTITDFDIFRLLPVHFKF